MRRVRRSAGQLRFAVVLLACAMLGVPASASALEPGDLVVADPHYFASGSGGLIGVDPADGSRTLLSGNANPPGDPEFVEPVMPAFEASGQILVSDYTGGALLRVDPATGARSVVTSATVGSGPAAGSIGIVAIEPDGNVLVTSDDFETDTSSVLRVDPVTGDRTAVSSDSVGTGPALETLRGLVLAPDGTIYALNSGFIGDDAQLIRIDPATGDRAIISSDTVGTGPWATLGTALAREPDGNLLVSDADAPALLRVNPATGVRTTVSSDSVGSGPTIVTIGGLLVDVDGSILMTDAGDTPAGGDPDGRVLRVDPASGDRTTVTSNSAPAGDPELAFPYGLAIVPSPAVPPPSYADVVLADGPVGYWRFGEPSGTTAIDSSPNGNDGAYLNGPILGVPGALIGDSDTAVHLDGVNDTVSVAHHSTLNVGNTFTVEGWLRRTDVTKTASLMIKGFQLVVMNAANNHEVWLRKPNVSTITRSATGVPADSAYHHIAVTKNASGPGAVQIYIDGQPVATIDVSPAQIIQNVTGPLRFGTAAGAPVDYDEFAIYPTVLTPSQIQAHYDAGQPTT